MLTSTNLLDPLGEIVASLFPSDTTSTLATRLDTYLSEGYTKAASVSDADARDAAAKHWAYARAYRNVYVRLSGSSSQINVGGALERTFTSAQVTNFLTLADTNQAVFDAILATGEEVSASGVPQASTTTCVQYAW